jgi:hypothetical protein
MLLTFGQISFVAIFSFVIGKIWTSNTEIFGIRQKAYSRFLEKCPHPSEVIIDIQNEQRGLINDQVFLEKIRLAAAEFSLFASPKAAGFAGQYFYLLGQIIVNSDKDIDALQEDFDTLQRHFHELILQMRKDSLGFT